MIRQHARPFTVSALVVVLALTHIGTPATAQPIIEPAPPVVTPPAGELPPGTGFVPPYGAVTGITLPAPTAKASLPARWDAREAGLVSPVKNQGACGSCYAFAAAADLESRILAQYGQLVDISENHLKECHYEGRSCNGGNATMVMNLVTRQGAVLESCDPYEAADVACATACTLRYAVRGWSWLQGAELPDVASLKQALLDHGPLSTTVFAGDASTPAWRTAFAAWNGGDGLHHEGDEVSNHAVQLVGWDDDHPHAGGGTGCWIVKNSWGAAWGDSCDLDGEAGYFYIAYGSGRVGTWTSVVTDVMPAYPELALDGWDEGGWTSEYGASGPEAWALARFDPQADTRLHCVEFWTTDDCPDIDVYVYADFDGLNLVGELAASIDHSCATSGYKSVALAEPLDLLAGDDYYVAVYFRTGGYSWPVAVDQQGARGAGHTWIGQPGVIWADLGADYGCEAGIRIRTSPYPTLASGTGDDPARPPHMRPADALRLAAPWPNPFNPRTTLDFALGARASVRLRIFDLQGRHVRTLVDGTLGPGPHRAQWNGHDDRGRPAAAGVYLARLEDGWNSRSRRVVLIK
jgi:C1A family cysteine protease